MGKPNILVPLVFYIPQASYAIYSNKISKMNILKYYIEEANFFEQWNLKLPISNLENITWTYQITHAQKM